MKRKIALILTLALSAALLAGCGGEKSNTTTENTATADTENSADVIESDCYVTFDDVESFDMPVTAYGEEFTLPEPENQENAGEFLGWIGMDGLKQPGDQAIAEEFMNFTALRTDKESGTVVMIDPVRGGYSIMSSTNEMELSSPYDDIDYGEHEDFFDYWTDDQGNIYQGREMVEVEKGTALILNAVYSTDTSAAYKVDIYSITGDEYTSEEYHRYVKKGESIPLMLMAEPAGMTFAGWYDAEEDGNLITEEMSNYTPDSDISIYAHWQQ